MQCVTILVLAKALWTTVGGKNFPPLLIIKLNVQSSMSFSLPDSVKGIESIVYYEGTCLEEQFRAAGLEGA